MCYLCHCYMILAHCLVFVSYVGGCNLDSRCSDVENIRQLRYLGSEHVATMQLPGMQ
jgi:hypothetical protein